MEILSDSVLKTEKFADDFLAEIKPRTQCATVVALSGNLGSGKTTFVQSCAKILGVKERVSSPTFVIIKNYQLSAKSYKLLIHIDAYRLKPGEELKKLRFDELLANPQNLIFIEWPENVAEVIPKEAIRLQFEFVDENTRKIGGHI